MNSWLDLPVINAMEYFGGILATAYKWASLYAGTFGLIGLCWSAFKLINSRMTIKDFWWDTLFKWVGFLLILGLYPGLTAGFSQIASEIGLKAGGGQQEIVTSLKNLRDTLKKDLDIQKQWVNDAQGQLSEFPELDLSNINFGNTENYNDYMDLIEKQADRTTFSSKEDKKKAQAVITEFKNKNKNKILFSGKTLTAIESVLIEKNIDGSEGDNLTNSYVQLDIWLKDSNGKDSHYLSPSAILRIALLNCQVMWEKENSNFNITMDDVENDDIAYPHWYDKVGGKFIATVNHIKGFILTFLCCLMIIFSTICCIIQYSMTIIEYTIVVAIGAIFLPLMLFDGTKDIPKKLIPVFIGFMVKMMVITICMMFVFWLFIVDCVNKIQDTAPISFILVADVAFNSILAYILTSNAPKIAQTILTGQPQLSMGEFVQGAAAAGGTVLAAGKAGVMGARAVNKAGVNATGNIKRAHATAKEAGNTAKQKTYDKAIARGLSPEAATKVSKSAGRKAAFSGAMSGLYAQPGKELLTKMKAGGNNFLRGKTSFPILEKAFQKGNWNGGTSGGPGGGSGGGKNPFEQSHADISNSFKDDASGRRTNLSVKEFYNEKTLDGMVKGEKIGNKQAQKADKAITKALEKQNQEKQSLNLPTNLSGKERPTDI